jgi:heme/copper-type cytochrome/quinol oxidase subunit 2
MSRANTSAAAPSNCGLEHTKMLLTVVAEPEEQFTAWVAERRG